MALVLQYIINVDKNTNNQEDGMKYALIDNLGRIKGTIEAPKGSDGQNIEYGPRDNNGIMHVQGIARITKLSDLDKDTLALIDDLRHYSL